MTFISIPLGIQKVEAATVQWNVSGSYYIYTDGECSSSGAPGSNEACLSTGDIGNNKYQACDGAGSYSIYTCVEASINGVCNNTARNTCISGTPNDSAVLDTSTYYKWRCDGISGGINSSTCQIAKPDNTVPTGTVSYSTTAWTKSDVIVTVTCSDAGSGCVQPTYTKIVTTNETLTIQIEDNAGNINNIAYTVGNIDKTIPSSASVIGISTSWVSSDTVTIGCSDSQSGCKSGTYQYTFGTSSCGSSWSTGISYTATENGYICVRVKDTVLNNYKYSTQYYIDKVIPTCATNYTWDGSSCTADTQIVSCSGSIPAQGYATTATTYTQTWDGSIWDPTITWDITGGTSCDYDCNSGYSGSNCIDSTNPIAGTPSYSPTGWTNGDVTVSVSCTDGQSGCVQSTYSNTLIANGTGDIYVYDIVGNSDFSTYNVTNIDKTDPTAGLLVYSPSGWTNGNVTVSVSCSDLQSGCIQSTYSTTVIANGSSTIIISDNVGNTKSVNYNVTNIDTDLPGGTINYNNGWTKNTAQTVTFTTSDGGSGVANYSLQRRISTNGPIFTTWGAWSTVSTTVSPYNYTAVNNTAYQFRLVVNDIAGNTNTITSTNTTKIDTTIPTASDIYPTQVANNATLEAVSRQFGAKVNVNNGSPITLIEGYFEDETTINSYGSLQQSTSDNNPGVSSELLITGDVTQVDNDATPNDGERNYSFKITKIADEAGNIITNGSGIKTYNYNVFADTTSIIASVITNQLDDGEIADGRKTDLTLELKDSYGNKIIPNTNINRKIDINFDVNNALYLNQYEQSGDAVFVNTPNNSIFTNKLTINNTFINQTSTTGNYNYQFKVFTPTFNPIGSYGQKLANGGMSINNILYTITQTIGVTSINNTFAGSTFDLNFKPLYTTQFTGDFKNIGILANTIQDSIIYLTKQSSTSILSSTISPEILIEFGKNDAGANISHPNFTFIYEPNGANNIVAEGTQGNITNLQPVGNLNTIGSKTFKFKVTHDSGTIDPSSTYLSSHVRYSLNDSDIGNIGPIVYDSDIINKVRYVDGSSSIANTNQVGLKVLGKIQSKNQQDLTTGQTGSDLYQLGNNTKSELKELIHKQVGTITKNIPGIATTGPITNITSDKWVNTKGTNIRNKSILYFKPSPNTNIEIGNGIDNLLAEGVKTIIVEGGNVYIKNNITYGNKSTDNLGIIVLEDENGNGGNIYIDPLVTNIVGTYFADRSVISYNGSEIDGGVTTNILNNQLYIYGTLFTENTIGGSIKTVPKCPYYVDSISCTRDIAKKYDLNFLRRYFVYEKDGDGIRDDIYANGNSYFSYGDSNFEYPVIIEYNPSIQITPPPLFSNE